MESTWLFSDGDQWVRIARVRPRDAGPRLLVHGPGTRHETYDFDDAMSCSLHQSELERRLVARNFRLQGFRPAARKPRAARRPYLVSSQMTSAADRI